MNTELKKKLSSLELSDLVTVIENHERDMSLVELSYNERLECMLEDLVTERHNKLISRLIRGADFKYPHASIKTLDCESREIEREKIINLAALGFINTATNLIITGPTGAGKTYLACALGIESCKQAYRTCYIRMPDMLNHIQNHKDNLREQMRYRKKLGNYKLLIIDEWLNYKINEKESKFIYELIEHRCGVNPTIFVGQYNSEDWHDRLGGGTQADSIMDRIIHNSYKVPSTENNIRKIYDSKKAKSIIDNL